MASAGVGRRGIYCVGKETNALESKGKVDGEIKGLPPVGHHMVVGRGDFQVTPDLGRWRGFPIIA